MHPAAGDPARVAPGDTLEITARLRLPLTPPPGVQQPRVWAGWSVVLRRAADRAAAGMEPAVEYRLRPFRVRPGGGDLYRVVAIVPPWLAGGTHDLRLLGPGIDGEAPRAVIVDDGVDPAAVLDVTLPPGPAGIAASLAGETLEAVAVAPSGCVTSGPGNGGRLVRFGLPPAAAERLRGGLDRAALGDELALEPVEARACAARIGLSRGGGGLAGGPVAAYEGDPGAHWVAWSIGERTAAAGPRALLSPLADAGAVIRATGYDGFGRPCRAERRVGERELSASSAGCGCSACGGRGRLVRLLRAIFFLSR